MLAGYREGPKVRFSPSSLESVAVLILLHSSMRKWQFVSSRLAEAGVAACQAACQHASVTL